MWRNVINDHAGPWVSTGFQPTGYAAEAESTPDVPIFIIDFVHFKEIQVFFLKCLVAMMLALVFDVA
jgi:hypothetical protein